MTMSTSGRPADTPIPAAPSATPVVMTPVERRWSQGIIGVCLLVVGGVVGGFGALQFAGGPASPTEAVSPAGESPAPPAGEVILNQDQQKAAGLQVDTVALKPLAGQIWRTGRISLNEDRMAHISPPTEGILQSVPVRIGQSVKAGTVLAVIESRELGQAKLEAYKARLGATVEREQLARTRITMNNAQELLELLDAETSPKEIEVRMAGKPIGDVRNQLLEAYTRRNRLQAQLASQRSVSTAIPESTILKTASEYDAASASYTAILEELRFKVKQTVREAELKLKDAETAYDIARSKLLFFGLTKEAVDQLDPIAEGASASWLTIKAPFDCTVVEKHAVVSERVGPQFQLFVLADLSKLWVEADVYESDLPLVRNLPDQSVVFRATQAGIPERKAKVLYSGDVIDQSTRTLTLLAEANNDDRQLKPGQFVEVAFATGSTSAVLQLPSAAILRHENRPFVFVKTAEDRFKKVEVTLGRTAEEWVEIAEGLKAGDQVVVNGGFVLKSELLKDQMAGE